MANESLVRGNNGGAWEDAVANTPAGQHWRLRTRLALGILLVFLPVFLLVLVIHLEALRDRRDSRVESLLTIDETLAASIDGFARDLETFSQSAAITLAQATEAGVPLTQQSFGRYFQELATSYKVRSIFITDLDGKVLAGTAGNVGFDVSSRTYFKALKGGADSTWSGALAGQLSGQTTLAYGRPVRTSDGPTVAYLFVAFYPPQLNDRLPPNLPDDADVVLIDNGGIVLLNTATNPDTPTIDISDSPEFQQASTGHPVVLRAKQTALNSDKRYAAFVPVETTSWVVGITRPQSAVDGPLNAQFRRNLLFLGTAFLAAIATMLFIADRVSRPLTDLAASAEAIARGEMPIPARSGRDFEIVSLQAAMGTMGEAIRERESRLANQANQLARLHASRNALAPLLPPDEIASIVIREAMGALGASAGSVLLVEAGRPTFRLAAHAGYSTPVAKALDNLLIDQASPFADAFVRTTPVLFDSATQQIATYPDQEELKRKAATGAAAFMPLRVTDTTLGVLSLGFAADRTFLKDEVELMFAFANQAAQSLHRSILYDTLERSNRSKDEFLAILGHELRTPITTIYGSTRLMNQRGAQLSPEEREELTRNVEEESSRMANLVENLLLLARAQLGRQPEKSRISLEQMLEKLCSEMRREYPQRRIHCSINPNMAEVVSDATALHQVIFNLLTNAAKYSPRESEIEVTAALENNRLEVHVLDRGPGVHPEELELIFQSFYRSAGTARTAPGQGIGLSVCRRLIEGLGGSVGATLRTGGGLDVYFTLPVTSELLLPLGPAEERPDATTAEERNDS